MRSLRRFVTQSVLALILMGLVPPAASAQWYPPYPAYHWAAPESSLRIEVTPKNAGVYVDGYFAGMVDDFDGTFQRLHVEPGEHEIAIYLAGHRTLRQRLYLSPNATRRIQGSLDPLAPGDPLEPEPVPTAPPPPPENYYEPQPPPMPQGAPRQPPSPRQPNQPPVPPEPPAPAPIPPPSQSPSRFGTIAIQVQPGDATIIIDGERWEGPGGNDRLIVQVTPGRHTIEADRGGYLHFVTEIDVERDRTATVNISMTKER